MLCKQVDTKFPRSTLFESIQQHPIKSQERTLKNQHYITECQLEKMIPKIILFKYRNHAVVNKKQIAVCKTCRAKIANGDATTSNFV